MQNSSNTLRKRFLVLDGGFATELERLHKKKLSSHLWASSMLYEDPDAIFAVHYSYFDAGADIVTTATYQASFPGFESAGYDSISTTEFFKKAIQLTTKARDMYWSRFIEDQSIRLESLSPDQHTPISTKILAPPLVAASLGCYGAHLHNGSEYTGDYGTVSGEQMYKFHLERIQAMLLQPGVDVLAFETVPKLEEGRVINDMLRKEGFNLPAWISYSCKDETNVSHGESFKECFEAIDAPNAFAVGINCTAPTLIKPLLQSLNASASSNNRGSQQQQHGSNMNGQTGDKQTKRIIVYPNSGESWDAENQVWMHINDDVGATSSDFARLAREEWIPSGASIIGGCCRTSPEYIRELKKNLVL